MFAALMIGHHFSISALWKAASAVFAPRETMRRREFIAGFGAIALSSPLAARAQGYPNKPIKIILPYTAGSPNDVIARFIAPYLSLRLRQPVIIENRSGGGTSIGAKAVMTAEPDGYTLLFSNSPTHVIASLGNATFTYDPLNDFAPVAMVGSSSLVLVIAPAVPAKSVQEFVAYAKANPGKLNFGFGKGTLPHLVGELFKVATGTDIASIPYRGGAQAVSDMLGGRIEMNFGSGSTLLPLIREGKLRALAVTSPKRSPDQPQVPTMIEAGLPAVTVVTCYGILGPAGMPAETIGRLNDEVNKSLSSADLKASMVKIGRSAARRGISRH
jgi:tripartite-type tricarboxylate transporter receptor subunit TctC